MNKDIKQRTVNGYFGSFRVTSKGVKVYYAV